MEREEKGLGIVRGKEGPGVPRKRRIIFLDRLPQFCPGLREEGPRRPERPVQTPPPPSPEE